MRLLFDQNLSFKLCERLNDVFPRSTQARLVDLDTADDQVLWAYARNHGFALITQDADFAEMAALHGAPPKIIWLRGGNRSTRDVETLLRRHEALLAAFERDDDLNCLELR